MPSRSDTRVGESAGRAGRGGITLNLRSIRLHDGRRYQFDGVVEGIRTPEGETISVDREGTLDAGDSQAQKAVERGAIGAALGAIIGAVAGGGKGAAIGAVIGAGGGAGTVIFGDRDRQDCRAARSSRSCREAHGAGGRSRARNLEAHRICREPSQPVARTRDCNAERRCQPKLAALRHYLSDVAANDGSRNRAGKGTNREGLLFWSPRRSRVAESRG